MKTCEVPLSELAEAWTPPRVTFFGKRRWRTHPGQTKTGPCRRCTELDGAIFIGEALFPLHPFCACSLEEVLGETTSREERIYAMAARISRDVEHESERLMADPIYRVQSNVDSRLEAARELNRAGERMRQRMGDVADRPTPSIDSSQLSQFSDKLRRASRNLFASFPFRGTVPEAFPTSLMQTTVSGTDIRLGSGHVLRRDGSTWIYVE
jgi:hypothetical protein